MVEKIISYSIKIEKLVKNLAKIKNLEKTSFLTFNTRLSFTQLKKAFTKTWIFQYFDLKYYIQIETNIAYYIIGSISDQSTSDLKSYFSKSKWYLAA